MSDGSKKDFKITFNDTDTSDMGNLFKVVRKVKLQCLIVCALVLYAMYKWVLYRNGKISVTIDTCHHFRHLPLM